MQIINDIKKIIIQANQNTYKNINFEMVRAYWLIGRRIVEEEQAGTERAVYGRGIIKKLSTSLQAEFGKGFSERNIEQMRQFYAAYPIPQTVSAELKTETLSKDQTNVPDFKLSWSHYQVLMRMADVSERRFYEIESANNSWSIRELKRQFDSGLFQRLALSQDKEG